MRLSALRSIRVASVALALMAALVPSARSECTSPVLLDAPIQYLTGPNAHFMVAGDFNEDGTIDLAVTNGDLSAGSPNSSLAVMIGTGNRTYAQPVLYTVGRGARGVVARDFNEDGITDLAVSNLFTNNISVLLGQGSAGVGNGTFALATNFAAGAGPFELVAADFNLDGILDLASCLNGSPGVCVLPGLGAGGVGNGTFGAAITFPLSWPSTGLAVGNFNGDGALDLVATENNGSAIALLLGTGSAILGGGSFSPAAYVSAGPQPFHVHVADFNGDSKQDLAVANTASGGIRVLIGSGTGTFTNHATLDSGNSSTVGTGDLNHDGIQDIVTGTVTGTSSGEVEVFLGQGSGGVWDGTFGAATHYASDGDVYQLITGDFDQDGGVDVLTAEGYGNHVALLPGTCAELPPDPRAPVLTDVRDVPNDNGGKVFLTWTASSLDVSGGAVNSYRVWRRIPPASMLQVPAARLMRGDVVGFRQSGLSDLIVYWEALATLPAQRLPAYGYTAATTQDSMHHSNPYTAFFVSALTSNIDVSFSSAIDSAYSVDNIRPHRPEAFEGAPQPSGFSLQWQPCPDADLGGYRVYRGASEDFVPSTESLISESNSTEWVDPSGHGEWFYKLSAVDIHENESDFSLLAPSSPVGVEPSKAVFGLYGARPNPSMDGRLRISFGLERGAGARLDVLDLAGRRILSRDLTSWGPGDHVLTVGDEKPLPSGIYFVRLTQEQRFRESKVVVTR